MMWKNVFNKATDRPTRRRLVLALAFGFLALAGGAGLMAADRTRAKRSVVSTEEMQYTIRQDTTYVGSEIVERVTYSDNVVVYRSKIESRLSPQMRVEQTTELELEEESYFPRRYDSRKTTHATGHEILQTAHLEMYANVGVLTLAMSPGREETRNVVMPAGTAVLETGVAHHLYGLVHAYNDESGGRQAFDYIDFPRGKLEQGVFFRAGVDTVSIMGRSLPVRVYTLERTSYTQKCLVDDEGRIVVSDFGYMRYELTKYARSASD